MDGKVQTIQERWKQRTDSAFERMIAGKSVAELETMTQREDMAVLIGRELAAFLLEEQVALDPAVQPSEASSACCPKCGRAGTPAVQKGEELPERTVVTRTGEIRVRRQRWRCSKCRVIFFPLDVKLQLGTEGYSPAVLSKAVRQASKAASFAEASDDLRNLADVEISATHLQRISERIGQEWAEVRDQEVEKFRESKLARTYQEAPRGAAAAVMLDGGRLQTRADDHGRGVSAASWRESKVACCLTLQTKAAGVDPHPEPPAKFLEPTTAARLASEIKRRSRPSSGRNDEQQGAAKASQRKKQRKKRKQRSPRSRQRKCARTRVRTVVTTMANSEIFGWQVAAEVHRRGLDQAKRKACVCDGQAYNWSVYEMHLLPLGFIAVLDFVHLLAYLHDAAHAAYGPDPARGWKTYVAWLRLAWSGKVGALLSQLRSAAAELAERGSSAADRKRTVDETVTYVTNNRERMDYPEYRRLGLPVSSAPVESTIKQINRRVKGSEKFWLTDGAEAMLQLRAAQLSHDDRWIRYSSRPRPHRAAGTHRLAQAA